jgi:hypothetical protein
MMYGHADPIARSMENVPSDTSIRSFLKALVSADDAHGVVSASAVSAGIGMSLLLMLPDYHRRDPIPLTIAPSLSKRRLRSAKYRSNCWRRSKPRLR